MSTRSSSFRTTAASSPDPSGSNLQDTAASPEQSREKSGSLIPIDDETFYGVFPPPSFPHKVDNSNLQDTAGSPEREVSGSLIPIGDDSPVLIYDLDRKLAQQKPNWGVQTEGVYVSTQCMNLVSEFNAKHPELPPARVSCADTTFQQFWCPNTDTSTIEVIFGKSPVLPNQLRFVLLQVVAAQESGSAVHDTLPMMQRKVRGLHFACAWFWGPTPKIIHFCENIREGYYATFERQIIWLARVLGADDACEWFGPSYLPSNTCGCAVWQCLSVLLDMSATGSGERSSPHLLRQQQSPDFARRVVRPLIPWVRPAEDFYRTSTVPSQYLSTPTTPYRPEASAVGTPTPLTAVTNRALCYTPSTVAAPACPNPPQNCVDDDIATVAAAVVGGQILHLVKKGSAVEAEDLFNSVKVRASSQADSMESKTTMDALIEQVQRALREVERRCPPNGGAKRKDHSTPFLENYYAFDYGQLHQRFHLYLPEILEQVAVEKLSELIGGVTSGEKGSYEAAVKFWADVSFETSVQLKVNERIPFALALDLNAQLVAIFKASHHEAVDAKQIRGKRVRSPTVPKKKK